MTLDLADGEARTGLDIELDPSVRVTGRLIDRITGEPVPGIQMSAGPAQLGGGGASVLGDGSDPDRISDDAGRFTLGDVAPGLVALRGIPC